MILEETQLIDLSDPFPLPYESLDFLETIDFLDQPFNPSRFKSIYLEVANFLDDQRFNSLIEACRSEVFQDRIKIQGLDQEYLEMILGPYRRETYSLSRIGLFLHNKNLREAWNQVSHYFPLNSYHLANEQNLCLLDLLHWASSSGYLGVIKYLVNQFKLNQTHIRNQKNQALRWASANGHLEVVQYLVEEFHLSLTDARSDNNYALRWASINGHLEVIRYLVEEFHLSLTDVRTRHNEALRLAAYYGHLPVVQYLVEHFKLTLTDARTWNNQALLFSAEHGYLPVVQYLVEYFKLTPADVRDQNNYALIRATYHGHSKVVQYLESI